MDEEQKNVIEDNGEPEKTIGSPETEESETIPVHPIAQTIDTHVLRICDLRANAFKLMKRAVESYLVTLGASAVFDRDIEYSEYRMF